jgi:hypothetical protein
MIVTLVANTTKYSNGLRKASGDTMSFGKIASTGLKMASQAAIGLGVALISSIPMLANMGAESRRADIQLRVMLGNMQGLGVATNRTVARLKAYATQTMLATGIDDEQIKAVQKKLLVFGALRKSVDKLGGAFDRTTQLSLDLAAGGFGDSESMATKLGKALENPTKYLGSLAKVGVIFTDGETKKIRALQKSGDLLKAQDIILTSLEKKYKGLAEESATPWEKLTVKFQDMGDTIGEALLGPLGEMNDELSAYISTKQGQEDLQTVVDMFVDFANAVKDLAKFLRDVKKVLDDISEFNSSLFGNIQMNGTVITGFGPTAGGNPSAPGGNGAGVPNGARSPVFNVNFNAPVDSVSAGREVARVLSDYNRVAGIR